MDTGPEVPFQVTETFVGVESWIDLPLIVVTLLLAGWVAWKRRRWRDWLFVAGLGLFMLKQSILLGSFLVQTFPAGFLLEGPTIIGAMGWILIAACAFAEVIVLSKAV
jgi:hypothetical protein